MEASPEGAEIIQGRIVGASDGGKIGETLRTTRTIDRFAKFFPFAFLVPVSSSRRVFLRNVVPGMRRSRLSGFEIPDSLLIVIFIIVL